MSKYWDTSWNPTVGCTPASEGCKNCWAETLHNRRYNSNSEKACYLYDENPRDEALKFARREGNKLPFPPQYDRLFSKVQLLPDRLSEPLRWRKPRTVAVCFMGDLFHEQVPDEFIERVFAVAAMTPQHRYLFLTKRAARMRAWASDAATPERVDQLKHIVSAGRLLELDAPERIAPIVDWPGYFVTSKGRVLSDRTNAGTRAPKSHELKPMPGADGHSRVMLQFKGRTIRPLISRLVLWAFDRHARTREQSCHINRDATNNALWNLRWGSQSDNWNDSKRHGTRRRYSKLTIEQVTVLRTRIAAGESAYAVAPEFGISDTQARNIARGDQWQPEPEPEWPLSNCWLGVTAENQRMADERIPLLLDTPGNHWVSLEPLLGPINWRRSCCRCPWFEDAEKTRHLLSCPLSFYGDKRGPREWPIHWVVVGGESGPKHRRMDLHWMLHIADQCFDAKVPYFGKQASGSRPNAPLPPSIARRELPW